MDLKLENFAERLAKRSRKAAAIRKEDHALACIAVFHVVGTGDCTHVNALFSELTKAEQAAFKRYIGITCAQEDGEVKTTFITMSKGKFVTRKDTERKLFIGKRKEVTTVEELHEGESFHTIDPDKVKNPFDTMSFVKGMHALIKKAENDEADVDATVIQFAKEAAKRMSSATKSITPANEDTPLVQVGG